MQMNLEIDDRFFPHFKAMIESFVKDKKVSILTVDDYDYTAQVPESVVVDSVEEVRRRVSLAEKRVADSDYLTEEEYEKEMDAFFMKELGIKR
jgi:hypothetical protein